MENHHEDVNSNAPGHPETWTSSALHWRFRWRSSWASTVRHGSHGPFIDGKIHGYVGKHGKTTINQQVPAICWWFMMVYRFYSTHKNGDFGDGLLNFPTLRSLMMSHHINPRWKWQIHWKSLKYIEIHVLVTKVIFISPKPFIQDPSPLRTPTTSASSCCLTCCSSWRIARASGSQLWLLVSAQETSNYP